MPTNDSLWYATPELYARIMRSRQMARVTRICQERETRNQQGPMGGS